MSKTKLKAGAAGGGKGGGEGLQKFQKDMLVLAFPAHPLQPPGCHAGRVVKTGVIDALDSGAELARCWQDARYPHINQLNQTLNPRPSSHPQLPTRNNCVCCARPLRRSAGRWPPSRRSATRFRLPPGRPSCLMTGMNLHPANQASLIRIAASVPSCNCFVLGADSVGHILQGARHLFLITWANTRFIESESLSIWTTWCICRGPTPHTSSRGLTPHTCIWCERDRRGSRAVYIWVLELMGLLRPPRTSIGCDAPPWCWPIFAPASEVGFLRAVVLSVPGRYRGTSPIRNRPPP